MRFIDLATECVERGWSIFPLSPGSKFPAVPKKKGGRGVLDATRDMEIIKGWARCWPRANVGLACGRASGFTVIDIDIAAGGMKSVKELQAKGQVLPPTISVRTPSGGWHLYFQYEPLLLNSQSKLGAGIDVRTTGGYVVAAGSRLDGGRVYSWHQPPIPGEPTPRMPRWAVEKLRPREDAIFSGKVSAQNASAAMQGLQAFIRRAGAGERNSALYWASRRAFENKWIDQGTINALMSAACMTGLSQKEALKTIGSALKAVTGGKVRV